MLGAEWGLPAFVVTMAMEHKMLPYQSDGA